MQGKKRPEHPESLQKLVGRGIEPTPKRKKSQNGKGEWTGQWMWR